jgi:hypothetical protein
MAQNFHWLQWKEIERLQRQKIPPGNLYRESGLQADLQGGNLLALSVLIAKDS